MKNLCLFIVAILILVLSFPTCTAKAAERMNVELIGTQTGTVGQVMTQALADIVNKNNPRVRMTVTETMGTTDSTKVFYQLPKEQKKFKFHVSGDWDFTQARRGRPPFESKIEDIMFVANYSILCSCVVTLDKNIKTKDQLSGKKVAVGPRASSHAYISEFIVWDIFGLKGKVDLQYLSWGAGKDAIADGLVHAYVAGSSTPPPRWAGNPAFHELFATRDVNIISISKADFDNGKRLTHPLPGDTA